MTRHNDLEVTLLGNDLQIIDHKTYKVLVTDYRNVSTLIGLLQHTVAANARGESTDHPVPPDNAESTMARVDRAEGEILILHERMRKMELRLETANNNIQKVSGILTKMVKVLNGHD